MHNIILTAVLLILGSASASAQFYTITKEKEILPEKQQKWLLIPYRGVWELMSLAKGRKGLTCPRGACETAFGAICPKSLRKGVPRKRTSCTYYSQSLSGNHPQRHSASEDSTGTSHTGNGVVPFTALPKPT